MKGQELFPASDPAAIGQFDIDLDPDSFYAA